MESGSKKGCNAEPGEEAVSSPRADEAAALGVRGDEAVAVAAATALSSSPAAAPAAAAGSARPYYECVFCKRGFTTAQALGGHMNIHRRDRAKPGRDRDQPAGFTTVSRNVECYNQYRLMAAYPPAQPAPTAVPTSSGSSFAVHYRSTAAAVDVEAAAASHSSPSRRELSLLLFGESGRHDRGGDGSPAPEGTSDRQEGEPERELDLELRLGHRPRH